MQFPNRNHKKDAIICGCTLIGGLIFAYVIFPPILRVVFKSQVVLKPGTQMREMYEVLPFPLLFKVYLFGVENPDEVQQGGKPHLREIGPYVFEEWKEKVDLVEDAESDTLEFTEKKTFIFSRELSSPLTGDEGLTMIHPLLTGIPLTVNVDRAPMLPIIAKAVDLLFDKPQTIFWTGKAMDIMFNGIHFDCSSTDFNAKAVCAVFQAGEVQSVWPVDEPPMHFKFAIFGGMNGTDGFRFKTMRGAKNLHDIGKVVEFQGEPEMDVWDGELCNELRGCEGSIFPPFRDERAPIWAFEAGICRSMATTYVGKSRYSGLPTARHEIDLGDIAADEELHCFCKDGVCPVKGTLDLFPCVGTTLVASMPHFLNADPKCLASVASGLQPDAAKHIIFLDMEAISGTPLSGAKRAQLNFALKPLEKMSYMQKVPEMLFPMMWVEEGANLNKTYVNMLKYQLFLGLKFAATVKWICIIVGIVGGIGSIWLDNKKLQDQSNSVTKIPATIEVQQLDEVRSGGPVSAKSLHENHRSEESRY